MTELARFSGISGPRAVKMLDIAAEAGVSRSTVSNVMRGSDTVAEDVRLRVEAAAERLGYVYNRGAASLRSQRSHLVGLVVPDLGNPFIAAVVQGIRDTLHLRRYVVVTASSDDSPAEQDRVLRSLAEHRIDGLLLIPAIETETDRPAEGGSPVVLINRDLAGSGLPFVGSDDAAIGRVAADHLINVHACRSVAYFGGPAAATPRSYRSSSFFSAAADQHAVADRRWSIACEPSAMAAYDLAAHLITSGPVPAGIHCHSDAIGFGLLRALREAGAGPDVCRVTSADDVPDAAFMNPSLTSISVDATAIGRRAAAQLLMLLDEEVESNDVPAPRLIPRASCGCA